MFNPQPLSNLSCRQFAFIWTSICILDDFSSNIRGLLSDDVDFSSAVKYLETSTEINPEDENVHIVFSKLNISSDVWQGLWKLAEDFKRWDFEK